MGGRDREQAGSKGNIDKVQATFGVPGGGGRGTEYL